MKDTGKTIGDWLDRLLNGRGSSVRSFSLFSRTGMIYAAVILVAIIIGAVLLALWRIRIRSRQAEATALAAAAAPDLADDTITAEQLPEDGWLRMAVEMIERGDLRLAVRAFYLASLAHLANRNLITLARFKSNRDYEQELARRAHVIPDLVRLFSDNVSTFDRIWYGLHDVSKELLENFRLNVERIKAC
jgi:hypothetical protein